MSNELTDVINALKQEGRKPTLALVKARLRSPVPLPLIIKALQDEQVDSLPETQPLAPFSPAQLAWIQDYVAKQLAPYQAALKRHGIDLEEN